ncbi:hypothetical protein V2J09_006396 [Rumex salicifolius]
MGESSPQNMGESSPECVLRVPETGVDPSETNSGHFNVLLSLGSKEQRDFDGNENVLPNLGINQIAQAPQMIESEARVMARGDSKVKTFSNSEENINPKHGIYPNALYPLELSWCGKESFGRSGKYLIRHHRLDVIVFFETQISGDRAKKVCENLRWGSSVVVNSQGRAGGLIVLWDSLMVSLNISRLNQNFIIAIAKKGLNEFTFVFAYAPPTQRQRTRFWQEIGLEIGSINGNLILCLTGRPPLASLLRGSTTFSCLSMLSSLGLMPRSVISLSLVRITRLFFLSSNPEAKLGTTNALSVLKQCGLLIPTSGASFRTRGEPRPRQMMPLGYSSTNFYVVFGELHEKKNKLVAQLDDLQTLIQAAPEDSIIAQEAASQRELAEVLRCEEILWRKKSRDSWLKDGDQNTSFFHISTLVHRRRNRISSLLDDTDQWIHSPRDLEDLVVGHFRDIYTVLVDELHLILTPHGLFPPLEASWWAEFSKEFSNDEIVGAV